MHRWTKVTCDFSERYDHTACLFDSKIFVFGGCGPDRPKRDLFVLDTDSYSWSKPQTSCAPPSCRTAHIAGISGDKMYIYGGWNGSRLLDDLYILDLRTLCWIRPRTSGTPPPGLSYAAGAFVDSKFYIFGGFNGRASDTLWMLDTKSMTWHSPETRGAVKPQARSGHTLVARGEKLYLFGGNGASRRRLNDTFVFDTSTLTWTAVAPPTAPPPRNLHVAWVLAGNTMCIAGGWDGSNTFFNDVYSLNLSTLEWTSGRLCAGGCHGDGVSDELSLPPPRYCSTATAVENGRRVVFIGGHGPTQIYRDVYVLEALADHDDPGDGCHDTADDEGASSAKLRRDMLKLLDSGESCDVTFVCGGDSGGPGNSTPGDDCHGNRVSAHSAVLSVRCPLFRAMFASGMREAVAKEIPLPHVRPSTLRALLRYIYGAAAPPRRVDTAVELLGLANEWMLDELKALCEKQLLRYVHIDNVCSTLAAADRYGAAQLRVVCVEMIAKEWEALRHTPDFAEHVACDEALMREIEQHRVVTSPLAAMAANMRLAATMSTATRLADSGPAGAVGAAAASPNPPTPAPGSPMTEDVVRRIANVSLFSFSAATHGAANDE